MFLAAFVFVADVGVVVFVVAVVVVGVVGVVVVVVLVAVAVDFFCHSSKIIVYPRAVRPVEPMPHRVCPIYVHTNAY